MHFRSKGARGTAAMLTAVGALTAGLVSGAASPASAATYPQQSAVADDTFYTAPSPLPALPHGSLLRYSPGNTLGTNSYVVMYNSTGADPNTSDNPPLPGAPEAVTGAVYVPTTPWTGPGTRPLVLVAPMTQGQGHDCAPSIATPKGTEEANEVTRVQKVLAAGYAAAVTDYDGYTFGKYHSYLVNSANGHAVLDIGLAASQIPGAGISPTTKTFIWGYSEGGGAAAFAGELWQSYAPSINLVGDATGGGVDDLAIAGKAINGGLFAGLAVATIDGYHQAYDSVPVDSIANPATWYPDDALLHGADFCVTQEVVDGAGIDVKNLTSPSQTIDQVLAIPAWAAAFQANQVGNLRIPVPTYFYYGVLDEILPQSVFSGAFNRLCAAGTVVHKNWYLSEHAYTNQFSWNEVVQFMADTLAGKPAVNSC